MQRVFCCNILLFIFSLLIGCSSHPNVEIEAPKPGKRVGDDVGKKYSGVFINEDFDPLLLRDEVIDLQQLKVVEARPAQSAEFQSKSDFAYSPEDAAVETAVDSLSLSPEKVIVPGWRIQICALRDAVKAREIFKMAEDVFEKYNYLKVYFAYDSPYYKVRIGDCISRYNADRLLQFAIASGFADAWVVKTDVIKQAEEIPAELFLDSEKNDKDESGSH